ncbi:3911_t:CDS:2 [Gigaspora margarita]|uniref:3911_t:CDS:1 n=1 Tax=Gigaspora margarita TaxID=4874 RepID=A0ABN7ULX9_GIGMA|nr:3911_t:CDS:2 [Gigaspora margarita]
MIENFCKENDIKSYPLDKYFKTINLENWTRLKDEDGYIIATVKDDPEFEEIKNIDGKKYNGLVILLQYRQSLLLSKLKHIYEKSKEDPEFEFRLLGTCSGRGGFINIAIEGEKIALRESKKWTYEDHILPYLLVKNYYWIPHLIKQHRKEDKKALIIDYKKEIHIDNGLHKQSYIILNEISKIEIDEKLDQDLIFQAKYFLEYCYKHKIGTEKDLKKAKELFKKVSILPFSLDYETNPEEQKEFIECITKAADSGNATALFNLGKLYFGYMIIKTVEKDEERGSKYLTRAAKKGFEKTYEGKILPYLEERNIFQRQTMENAVNLVYKVFDITDINDKFNKLREKLEKEDFYKLKLIKDIQNMINFDEIIISYIGDDDSEFNWNDPFVFFTFISGLKLYRINDGILSFFCDREKYFLKSFLDGKVDDNEVKRMIDEYNHWFKYPASGSKNEYIQLLEFYRKNQDVLILYKRIKSKYCDIDVKVVEEEYMFN